MLTRPRESAEDLFTALDEALRKPARQQPDWADHPARQRTRQDLALLPPLTLPAEIDLLRTRLAAVARGEAFLLQGGDCAETFADTTEAHIRANVSTLVQLEVALTRCTGWPVVTVGRLAGQYAKPRSQPQDADGLPSYRGDLVNAIEPDPLLRQPDPHRMMLAYQHSNVTLNLVRALCGPGNFPPARLRALFAGFAEGSAAGERFAGLLAELDRGLRYTDRSWSRELFSSHEALVLDYERALVRLDPDHPGGPRLYSGATHFPWIGERTRQWDGAHLAFAAQLANPIGLKIGPGATALEVSEYLHRLDPHKEPGRVTLITRMGSDRVRALLPPIVREVEASGHRVVWQCDPMHANGEVTECGRKTRQFDRIVDEVQGFFEVHRLLGTHPGGLHLELTGEDVTECLGGAAEITPSGLARRYETACDPRLNGDQALELTLLVAEMLRG
nr:3-deoxy-7-phosphoheptulonate synthase class II [Crossiella cryophila]